MPDIATARQRTVQISGSGQFGIDSAAAFNPGWSIGGPTQPSRVTWGSYSLVGYWGRSVWTEVLASDGWVNGAASYPSVTLTIHYGGFSKSVTITGTAYTGSTYPGDPQRGQQYFAASQGSFTFLEVVDCVQHFNPNPVEVRTGSLFTCMASINASFVDTLGSGSQTIAASLTFNDTEMAGWTSSTYADYDYLFHFGSIPVHFDLTATIAFDQPGLISTYSGITTYWGNAHLAGNGSSVTWHWNGGEGTLNPGWDRATVPVSEIDFYPSWAFSVGSEIYHYKDATEVGATLEHWYGTHHIGDFASGGPYRYPGAGLIHWLQLDQLDPGQKRDGTGWSPGSPVASDPNYDSLGGLQGDNYGPIGLLFQVPGDPIGAALEFRVAPAWANGYGTRIRSEHPHPNARALMPKLWQPYNQGTIQWDDTHRFVMFEAGGAATQLTHDAAASDTAFQVISTAGFAVGDTILVDGTATYTVASLATGPPRINLSTTVGATFLTGDPVVRVGGRWNIVAGPPTFPGAQPDDGSPAVSEVTGAGIDGHAIQVGTVGHCRLTTGSHYLLKHQGYRYARLQVKAAVPATTLTSAALLGATDLAVADASGFHPGDHVTVGGDDLTVSAVSTGHLTVSATPHAYASGSAVTRSGGGRVLFTLTGSSAGTVAWLFLPPADGTWATKEFDLARPDYVLSGGTWMTTEDFQTPHAFFPDPLPVGGYYGAQVAVEPLDAGTYSFDYLEGFHKTDGDRTAVLFFPFLDGQGDYLDLITYEEDPAGTPTSEPIQYLGWVVNGVRAVRFAMPAGAADVTATWNKLVTLLDTTANDTGIHIVIGTAGDPDLKMQFGPTNQGQYAFDALTGYGLKPALDLPLTVHGQLRPYLVAGYYGAGDLMSTSGGYGAEIVFTLDWLFDGEMIGETRGGGGSVTLADNDTGATVITAAADADGMVRLPAKYGVYHPYDNTDDSAEWFQPATPAGTTLTALAVAGDTILNVASSAAFAMGDVALVGFGENDIVTVTAVASGTLTVTPALAYAFGYAAGEPVAHLQPPIDYTALGMAMNSYWLKGAVTPKDSEGYLATGDPPVEGAPKVRTAIVILDRYQSFYVFKVLGLRGIWNLHDRVGAYHRASIEGGKVRYRRSDKGWPASVPAPAWDLEVDATAGPADTEPRMSASGIDRLHLLFVRDGDVMIATSDDDGATWSDPVALFSGGRHPANCATDIGTVIHAAYLSGQIQAKEEFAPEQFSDPWTFVDAAAAPITIDDDTFCFSLAREGAARYLLVAVQAGAVSEWTSADDCRTWEPVT